MAGNYVITGDTNLGRCLVMIVGPVYKNAEEVLDRMLNNPTESDKRIINIVTPTEEYSFYGKLDTIEEQLKKQDFVRCHQSYLVNAKKITSVKMNEVTLSDSKTIPVSKRRSKETNEAFLWAMR